jgi:hypothetical protein
MLAAVPAAALAVAVVALGGCGGSSGVKPAGYVKSICTAITGWRNEVQTATAQFERAFPHSSSLPVAKRRLTEFVASLLRAATRGITATKAAGVPDVSGGRHLAVELVWAFENAQRSLAQAASAAMLIPTSGTQAFAVAESQVRTAVTGTLHTMNTVSPGTNRGLSREIARQPACAALRPPGG